MRCVHLNRIGEQCRDQALEGRQFCAYHSRILEDYDPDRTMQTLSGKREGMSRFPLIYRLAALALLLLFLVNACHTLLARVLKGSAETLKEPARFDPVFEGFSPVDEDDWNFLVVAALQLRVVVYIYFPQLKRGLLAEFAKLLFGLVAQVAADAGVEHDFRERGRISYHDE